MIFTISRRTDVDQRGPINISESLGCSEAVGRVAWRPDSQIRKNTFMLLAIRSTAVPRPGSHYYNLRAADVLRRAELVQNLLRTHRRLNEPPKVHPSTTPAPRSGEQEDTRPTMPGLYKVRQLGKLHRSGRLVLLIVFYEWTTWR